MAASRLPPTVSMVWRRRRRTLTSMLAALSSPRRSAVKAQAFFHEERHGQHENGGGDIEDSPMSPLVRLPMVQKTTAASACLEARYSRSERAALKVKTSAMPRSTMVSTLTPRMVDAK